MFSTKPVSPKKFSPDVRFIDMQGANIAPGFIDTHIHGIGGCGTDDLSSDSILKMSEILPQYGVTSFIPTLYSAPKEQMLKAIRAVVDAIDREKGAKILGIHLEGPFISPSRLGVQSAESLSPVDISLMDEFLAAAEGHIINMTVAPELKICANWPSIAFPRASSSRPDTPTPLTNKWLKACRCVFCTRPTCSMP